MHTAGFRQSGLLTKQHLSHTVQEWSSESKMSGVQAQSHSQVQKHLSDSSGEDCTSRPKSCQSSQVLISQLAHKIVVVHYVQVHGGCSKLEQHFPQHAERTQLQSRVDPEFKNFSSTVLQLPMHMRITRRSYGLLSAVLADL